MYQRRSIRRFKDTPVESEKVQQLIEAALTAPAARNLHTTHYVIVDDKETIQKMAAARDMGAGFVANAPLAIVVLGDSEALDVWIENASIAAAFIMLEAQSLGLGTCWAQIRNRSHNGHTSSQDYMRDLLHYPDGMQALCIVAVGYPDEQKRLHSKDKLAFDHVHYNVYGNKK